MEQHADNLFAYFCARKWVLRADRFSSTHFNNNNLNQCRTCNRHDDHSPVIMFQAWDSQFWLGEGLAYINFYRISQDIVNTLKHECPPQYLDTHWLEERFKSNQDFKIKVYRNIALEIRRRHLSVEGFPQEFF